MELSGPTRILFALGLVVSVIAFNQLGDPTNHFRASLASQLSRCNTATLKAVLGPTGCDGARRTTRFVSVGR
ncbi:hypothetical protein [Halocynthiibacter namhaensis]|uniref:hypothetical protein n=1 Tax=Halocynthiibacter namhaensis TaxID=1290553 RepID=UPI00057941B6|nr:hypothetical protein [Halocynthiibacter namhaensis]